MDGTMRPVSTKRCAQANLKDMLHMQVDVPDADAVACLQGLALVGATGALAAVALADPERCCTTG